jgi:MazG family protein
VPKLYLRKIRKAPPDSTFAAKRAARLLALPMGPSLMPKETQSPTPNASSIESLKDFVATVAKLRAPDGCPWDREQTHRSLVPYLIEEAYELAEAIENGRDADILEELGDVLLQVVLHAQIASESRRFSIDDVANEVNEKMIRRHPHVFGDALSGRTAADFAGIKSDEVLKNWNSIKATEKKESTPAAAEFRFDVPVTLPALQRSAKIGEKTRKRNFDWPDWRGVMTKIDEEMTELKRALAASKNTVHLPTEFSEKGPSNDPIACEIGDLLFTVAQLARHRGLDPEQCLRDTNSRFERRFEVLNQMAAELEKADGRNWDARAQSELETLWQKAKDKLRAEGRD